MSHAARPQGIHHPFITPSFPPFLLLSPQVVIVTHAYGDRNGVRLLTRGLKVYYLPIPEMYNGSTFPLFYANFPFLRCIFIRERINHVHGHQAFSSLCHEGLFHASTMNIPCTFTDHSLFGFADASSIFTNKALKFALSGVDNVICVSHTSKENTVLRAALDPARVFVIPNAVLSEQFTPDPSQTSPGHGTFCCKPLARVTLDSHDCCALSAGVSQGRGSPDVGDPQSLCRASHGALPDRW